MSIKDGPHTVLVTHPDVLICQDFEGGECSRRPLKPDNGPNVAGINAFCQFFAREIRAHPQVCLFCDHGEVAYNHNVTLVWECRNPRFYRGYDDIPGISARFVCLRGARVG